MQVWCQALILLSAFNVHTFDAELDEHMLRVAPLPEQASIFDEFEGTAWIYAFISLFCMAPETVFLFPGLISIQ